MSARRKTPIGMPNFISALSMRYGSMPGEKHGEQVSLHSRSSHTSHVPTSTRNMAAWK